MRRVGIEYVSLRGGKKSFRKLPQILRIASYGTSEYSLYKSELESDAKRLSVDVSELELNDDEFDYESIKW